ncbi:MAG: formylglycine-generating enzyme family protein [Treponema sp.]|nr:formylglycine-generating enzyme family protein [Treponema sp.]
MKKISILIIMACFLVAGLAAQQSNMMRINGGTFTMGSPANEAGRDSGEIQRQVTVSSFSIGKYPVTVDEYRRFVNATNYRTVAELIGGGIIIENGRPVQKADANWKNPYISQTDHHPVVMISWLDAVLYCNWLSEQEGLIPAYTGDNNLNVTWNRNANGYRLPTEAEWEYACRAGTTTAYNTGATITTNQANFSPFGADKTTSIGDYPANAWGLHDMHGNVYEWCWDWYGAYPSGAQTNPIGAVSGSLRVARGGSWNEVSQGLRSANRFHYHPLIAGSYFVGFRVVRP